MKERFIDKRTGVNYILQGDYYLPCLSLPERNENPISIWGQRHLRYIKNHRKVFYYNLLTNGNLNNYITGIDDQAKLMFDLLVRQFAENEGITEKLKAENPILWIKRINNICNQTMELVNKDLIYI